MHLAVASRSTATDTGRRIRVMVVDDAIVVRGLFARWIEAEPDFEVVASLRTGREAVAQVERADPDVVVLDVDMPEMDGIAALPLLLERKRDLVVIMASTLTRRNAEISLKALSLGAADYIPKPASNREVTASLAFRRELVDKIRSLGQRARRPRLLPTRAPPVTGRPAPVARFRAEPASPVASSFNLRPMPTAAPRVLLIGASTGGPQALNLLMAQIGSVVDVVPVLITQHMPPTFTAILAEHLSRITQRPVHEAVDGEEVRAGAVYLAPGGKHMRVARRGSGVAIALDDGELINFCKPAVDPLFTSATTVWGSKTFALVLTGMGADGLVGAREIVAAGGHVIAQDEATSVVWGMPGQVSNAGLCSAVLPIGDIGSRLSRLFAGERA